ncbi:ABC transporter ATP-binding protein [Actinoallomurus sp. CA-142502]|uniref:ABC transporter ATP-binding protein n=1 Tax=Actinoallomurus sp. CA-142502 TaxID=3239885 RepID=UPI003D8B54B3
MTSGHSPVSATPDTPPDPSDQALARCTGVARTFGFGVASVVAVHDLSCAVWPEARIAVTGPSGSGKSTLLHLIAGLEIPTGGTVDWPGLGGLPQGRPGLIGMIFQGPSLIPTLNVTENVALPLQFAGISAAAASERAARALDQLGIAEMAAKLPEELSGGQAQRVAVARALASRPRLILADEPTGQLDHEAADHVISVLLRAADELGAAVVVSTHDPKIAARLPERWTMSDGELTQQNGSAR